MTTIKTYKCDLCSDPIAPTPYATAEGFGVWFSPNGTPTFKRAVECEHHICLQCAKGVHDAYRANTTAAGVGSDAIMRAAGYAKPPAERLKA